LTVTIVVLKILEMIKDMELLKYIFGIKILLEEKELMLKLNRKHLYIKVNFLH
jgi:hypothetical protein